jgi:methylmalonyl-CoA mutase cobalamin-binding subunit
LASLELKLKLALVETVVAAGPERIVVSGGVVSPEVCTVQPRVAGVGSVLPEVSTALTATVCPPGVKEEKDSDSAQAFQEAESSLHSKLELLSLEEKSKLAVVDAVAPEGPATIDVLGGVVSPSARTVQLRLAGEASVLPAASVALTEKVCEPIVSELYSLGELQLLQGPESSLHSKLELLSLEAKPKLALVEVVAAAGPERIVVLGAVTSLDGPTVPATTAVATARRIPAGLGTLARSRGFVPASTSLPSPTPSPSLS